VICPGYNVRKYEKWREEQTEKLAVKRESYYTPPGKELDFNYYV